MFWISMRSRGKVVWLSKGAVVDQPDFNTTAALLDLGDYFSNGELRCVVATEDTEKDALKALLWSNDFVEADTEVVSYAGCSKVDAAIVLGQFLGGDRLPRRMVARAARFSGAN
jgi:hypothetical protein